MTNPNTLSFSKEDIGRLRELVKEGVRVLAEIQILREGLSETVKAVGEEIDVKAAQLNKTIRIAYKDSMFEERQSLDEIEYMLELVQKARNP